MDKTYDEYIKEVKNVSGKRNHKIKGSLNILTGYSRYNKTKPKHDDFKITTSQYLSIIKEMNLIIGRELVLNGSFKLPAGIGSIRVLKSRVDPVIDKNGKLFLRKPIDMNATLKLWYEDEESRHKKTLVRYEGDYSYRFMYERKGRHYKNSTYFAIKFNRELKKTLRDAIVNSDYDAYEIKRYNNENKEMD